MPPKAWGPRERGVKCFTRTCPTEGPPSENLRRKIQLISQVHDIYIWYGRSHPNRVCYNLDLGYGRSHPTQIKQIDSGMVAAIQSVSHVHNDNNPQSQPGLQQTQSRVLRSISTQTKYKFEHVNLWAEVKHARTSPDYQPMMKAVNRRERNHQ